MMNFLEDIVAETDTERGVILIEDEDEISPNVNRPQFSSDPIFGSRLVSILLFHLSEQLACRIKG